MRKYIIHQIFILNHIEKYWRICTSKSTKGTKGRMERMENACKCIHTRFITVLCYLCSTCFDLEETVLKIHYDWRHYMSKYVGNIWSSRIVVLIFVWTLLLTPVQKLHSLRRGGGLAQGLVDDWQDSEGVASSFGESADRVGGVSQSGGDDGPLDGPQRLLLDGVHERAGICNKGPASLSILGPFARTVALNHLAKTGLKPANNPMSA